MFPARRPCRRRAFFRLCPFYPKLAVIVRHPEERPTRQTGNPREPKGKKMQQSDRTRQFLQDESGAVTVDWIVLTSVIVGLGVAVASMMGGGTKSLTSRINEQMSNAGNAAPIDAGATTQVGF
jgi:Flp pilus assembly pilin Flp